MFLFLEILQLQIIYSQYQHIFTLIKYSSEKTIRVQLCDDNEIHWTSLKGHSQDVLNS